MLVESGLWVPTDVPRRFPKRLKTANPDLELLRAVPGAGRFIYPLYDRNRDHIARSGDVVAFTSPADVDTFLGNQTHVNYVMAYQEKGRERFAGVVGIDASSVIPFVGVLNYFTDVALQGRHIAHDAVDAVVTHALTHAGVRQVWANVRIENEPSQSVVRGTGFHETLESEEFLLFVRSNET